MNRPHHPPRRPDKTTAYASLDCTGNDSHSVNHHPTDPVHRHGIASPLLPQFHVHRCLRSAKT